MILTVDTPAWNGSQELPEQEARELYQAVIDRHADRIDSISLRRPGEALEDGAPGPAPPADLRTLIRAWEEVARR